MQSGRLISTGFLRALLYLTATLLVAGHVVNRLTSPRPLNPFWNRISTFAASHYGGQYVTGGIALFAICIPVFGSAVWSQLPPGFPVRAGGICAFPSTGPMLLVAIFPIFSPRESAIAVIFSPGSAAISSNHIHEVSSAIGFALLLSAVLLWSISFLRDPFLKCPGQIGILIVPIVIFFLVMTYHATTYNGSWQRCAFLLLFSWLLAGSYLLRYARAKPQD